MDALMAVRSSPIDNFICFVNAIFTALAFNVPYGFDCRQFKGLYSMNERGCWAVRDFLRQEKTNGFAKKSKFLDYF